MKGNLRWAFKVLILSFFLSFFFSFISQSLFPTMSIFLSVFIIVFFVAVSVIFDMISVAVTSIKAEDLQKYKDRKEYKTAIMLCKNTEKVSSFCGDVVGDICGILSGAGGVSLVLKMNIQNLNIYFMVTCFVSSLIAGITIFGKAVMKRYSVDYCDSVVLRTARIIEFSLVKALKNRFSRQNKAKADKKERK